MKSSANTAASAVVMIIDDDGSTRMMASEFLTQAGFTVFEAANGSIELDTINEVDPDIILLDVEMPGRDGFDVCRAIRNQQQFIMTPILMLTGLDQNRYIDMAYEAGATDFATKPLHWSLL